MPIFKNLIPGRKPLPWPPESENILQDAYTINENTVQENENEPSLCVPYSTVSELCVYKGEINRPQDFCQGESGNKVEATEAAYELETADDNIFY